MARRGTTTGQAGRGRRWTRTILGDIIKDFLIESSENIARLEQEMVDLEQRPNDLGLLNSIFRTIHTIKGTCGFLAFSKLEKITHVAESLLNQLRNGERPLTEHLVSLILETVDAVKAVLGHIEAAGDEGPQDYADLERRLAHAVDHLDADAAPEIDADEAPSAPVTPPTSPAAPATPAARVSAPIAAPVDAAPMGPAAGGAAYVAEQAEASPAFAPAAEAQPDATGSKGPSIADSTIRVDVGLLDKLMNLVGELVLARNQILQFNTEREDAALNATSQRLNLITTELQEGVMKTRMQPIGNGLEQAPARRPRPGHSSGKQVRVEMEGAETELDKIDHRGHQGPAHPPRPQLVRPRHRSSRNPRARGKPATGTLSLRAFHEGGQVNIEIADDGAGIDTDRLKEKAVARGCSAPSRSQGLNEREALNLIFLPGFSTADKVTNISGRGVGMDVVKTNIEKIGGTVDLTSTLGHGTTVKIKIPLTLAIIPAWSCRPPASGSPSRRSACSNWSASKEPTGKQQIERIKGTPVYRLRGHLLPLVYLHEVLRLEATGREAEAINIVVLQADDRQFGLVVDGINDTQEIVVKPLGKQLKGLSAYAGATIMGDGHVALILDVLGLGQLANVLGEVRDTTRAGEEKHDAASANRQSFLVFRAGRFERVAVPLSLVARLEEFPRAQLEQASGHQVIQYRGQILPLVPVADVLEPGAGHDSGDADPVPVVVFSHGSRMIGIIVDQIVDIVDDAVTVKQRARGAGLAGSAVIGTKVTDFLDVQAVLQAADETWFSCAAETTGLDVLIAEASPFARGLMRNYLEMAGHRVYEAADGREAIERLERDRVDLLVAAIDLPPHGGLTLLEQVRADDRWNGLPTIGLTPAASAGQWPGVSDGGFHEYQLKCDREALVGALERLHASPSLEGRKDEAQVLVAERG